MIPVTVNGQERDVQAGATVAALLAELGLEGGRVAVELDGEIVPRSDYPSTVLSEGSRLEIVRFVGGG